MASAMECVRLAPVAGISSGGMARELAGAVRINRSAKGNSMEVISATALSRSAP